MNGDNLHRYGVLTCFPIVLKKAGTDQILTGILEFLFIHTHASLGTIPLHLGRITPLLALRIFYIHPNYESFRIQGLQIYSPGLQLAFLLLSQAFTWQRFFFLSPLAELNIMHIHDL